MKPTAGGYGNVKCHETAQYKTNLVTVAASREHLRVPFSYSCAGRTPLQLLTNERSTLAEVAPKQALLLVPEEEFAAHGVRIHCAPPDDSRLAHC